MTWDLLGNSLRWALQLAQLLQVRLLDVNSLPLVDCDLGNLIIFIYIIKGTVTQDLCGAFYMFLLDFTILEYEL
jgi:hypothetical protein